jgi:DNA polymerase zeta
VLTLPADIDVQYVDDELHLLELFVSKVRLYDPDILAGYELHNSSWGYIIERCVDQYGMFDFSRFKVYFVYNNRVL